MKMCEVCAESGVNSKGPLVRVARFFDLKIYMDLCKKHALALTHRELQAAEPPISRQARRGCDQFGRMYLLEVC